MLTPDRSARFQTLVEEHKKILYKVCSSYCRSRDDREDLAQEITVQLWRSFGTFDDRCRFSTWMYRIALNVAISFYRRESTRTHSLLPADACLLEEIPDTASQPEEIMLLYQFIERLDPLNKGLLLLYLDGYSYREIAEVLGITETNVATKIGRLKQTMKQEFSGSAQDRSRSKEDGTG